MSHRLKTARQRVQTGDNRSFEGASNIEAYTLVKNDSERVPEGSLTCSSPVCEVRFEQTGTKMEPRKYCCDRCRLDAWHLREASKLLENETDERALAILRRLSFQA
jgi:hypothetical protein